MDKYLSTTCYSNDLHYAFQKTNNIINIYILAFVKRSININTNVYTLMTTKFNLYSISQIQ